MAIILLGGLTFVMSRSTENNPDTEIQTAANNASATSILAYTALAKQALDRMLSDGIPIEDITYWIPSNGYFDSTSSIHNIFHPDGGGLQYKPLPARAKGGILSSPVNGYYIGRFNNVLWTPTTEQDVIFVAYGIKTSVCKELNKKVTGDATIPTVGDIRSALIANAVSGVSNANFTTSTCSSCEDKPSMCVAINPANDTNVYYSILYAH